PGPALFPYTTLFRSRSGLSLGELTYLDNCSSCHGVEFNGNEASGFPSLVNLETKFDNSEIEQIVSKGRGMMPGFPHLTDVEVKADRNSTRVNSSHVK